MDRNAIRNHRFLPCFLLGAFALGALSSSAWGQETDAQRLARIQAMSPEEKEELKRKRDRFAALPPAEQARLRRLHTEIQTAPDGPVLEATLARYNEWLKTLNSADQAALLDLPPAERIVKIRELHHRQELARAKEHAEHLPEQDHAAIFRWLETYVGNHLPEFIAKLPPEARQRIEKMAYPERRRTAVLKFLAFNRPGLEYPQPTPAELQQLIGSLSEVSRRELENKPTDYRQQLIRGWIVAAVRGRFFPPLSESQRKKFFAELPPAERERLEALPPAELNTEITRLYYQQLARARQPGKFPLNGPAARQGDKNSFGPVPRPGKKLDK